MQGLSAEAMEALEAELLHHWCEALDVELRHEELLRKGPARMVLRRPRLSRAAGLFWVENPTGHVAALRACATRAAERVAARMPSLPPSALGFSVPGIIHSTFLRFHAGPPPAAEFAAAFEAVADLWRDVEVDAESVCLALEQHPYMHVTRSPSTVGREWRLPLPYLLQLLFLRAAAPCGPPPPSVRSAHRAMGLHSGVMRAFQGHRALAWSSQADARLLHAEEQL